jgi:peroxiredoxin
MAVEVGMAAPDFSLYDADRKATSLSDFRGKNVVLAFYPGAFTGVCTTEMCTFRDRMDGLNSLNAQVLGISVDGAFAQKAFSDQNNLNFPLLSDFQREAVNQYDLAIPNFAGMEGYIASKRAVYVVDGEGVVRYAWVGPNPGVEPDYDEVQAELGKLSG